MLSSLRRVAILQVLMLVCVVVESTSEFWERSKRTLKTTVWTPVFSWSLDNFNPVDLRELSDGGGFKHLQNGIIPGIKVGEQQAWYTYVIQAIFVIPQVIALVPVILIGEILLFTLSSEIAMKVMPVVMDTCTLGGFVTSGFGISWLYNRFVAKKPEPVEVEDTSFTGKAKKFVSTPFGKLAAGLGVAGAVAGGAYAVYRYKPSACKADDVSDDSGSRFKPWVKRGAKSGKGKNEGSGYTIWIVSVLVVLAIIGVVVFFTCGAGESEEEIAFR